MELGLAVDCGGWEFLIEPGDDEKQIQKNYEEQKKLHVKKIEPKVVEFGGVNVLVSEGMTPEEIMAAYERAKKGKDESK
jgi:hypothetical protein